MLQMSNGSMPYDKNNYQLSLSHHLRYDAYLNFQKEIMPPH